MQGQIVVAHLAAAGLQVDDHQRAGRVALEPIDGATDLGITDLDVELLFDADQFELGPAVAQPAHQPLQELARPHPLVARVPPAPKSSEAQRSSSIASRVGRSASGAVGGDLMHQRAQRLRDLDPVARAEVTQQRPQLAVEKRLDTGRADAHRPIGQRHRAEVGQLAQTPPFIGMGPGTPASASRANWVAASARNADSASGSVTAARSSATSPGRCVLPAGAADRALGIGLERVDLVEKPGRLLFLRR